MLWDLISSSTLPKLNISQIKLSETRIFFRPAIVLRRKCWKIKSRIPGIKRRSDKYPDKEELVFSEAIDLSGADFVNEFKNSATMRASRLLAKKYTRLPAISKPPAICKP